MNSLSVRNNIFNIFLLPILLTGFLISPKIILADDFDDVDREEIEKHLQLPDEAVENLLHSLIGFFTSQWINQMASGYSTAEEGAVPAILRGATRAQALNHLLVDAPVEVGFGIVNNGLKIARLFGIEDISGLINEFERQSVKKAINYGMRRLFENDIRITPGAISFKYDLEKGGTKEAIFQYLMIYKPIDEKRGKLVIRFYSTNSLEIPKKEGSGGGIMGTYNELTHPLPPFIVDIQGEVENYQWIGQPSMKIGFPPSVPDLGIRPLSFWDRQIWKPLVAQVKEVEVIITKIAGKSVGDKIFGIPKAIKGAWNTITAKIGGLLKFGGAEIVQRPEETVIEPTEQPVAPEEEPEPSQQPTQPLQPKPPQPAPSQSNPSPRQNLSEMSKPFVAVKQPQPEPSPSPSLIPSPSPSSSLFPSPSPTPAQAPQSQPPQPQQAALCQKRAGDFPQRNKVIFNEIAWMGSVNSASDEWVELKNVSREQIDLSGWQMSDKDGKIKVNFDIGRVSTDDFLLMERTNDETVPSITADLIYTGGLNNNNETLYLFDGNCVLQDEVIASQDWPAGDNSSKRTMERKWDLNWQTSANPGGTPKRENSSGYTAIVISGGGGGTSGGGSVSYTPPVQQTSQPAAEPQITLSFPGTTTADKEIEVQISAANFKSAAYDVKIFIESGTTTLSEIYNEKVQDWQSSRYYATSVFSGASFSGNFKLRIKEDKRNFRGEADVIAKIRQSDSEKIISEFKGGTISIYQNQVQNQPPAASFNFSPHNPFFVGRQILFDAASSTDADGVVLLYLWDFGDNATGSGATTSHAFLRAGTSTVGLFIFDDKGATSSTSTVVEISASPAVEPPTHILITEVRAVGSEEFVEFYNPTNEATSTNGWYMSYFSADRDWNEPYINKSFPTTTIPAKSYFLIGFGGFNTPNMDWKADGRHLSDDSGAIGIFSADSAATSTSASTSKIDVLGWGSPIVKEGTSTQSTTTEKSFARRIATTSEGVLIYVDSDNNISDFEIQEPTPKAQNRHQFSDLDGDGIVDAQDSTTTITTTLTLKAGEYKFRDLVIMGGGKLILNSSTTFDGFKGVKIVADNVIISTSSSILADGRGYSVNDGPSAGLGEAGAGYGGRGGGLGNNSGGQVYGSFERPVDLGSGGGASRPVGTGSGGGAIWLKIENNLVNDGLISANGENGDWRIQYITWATGAGSGGSIYIETNNFSGSGKITANGGKTDTAGAGGGGRIAVYYSTNNFNGTIQAFGGEYLCGIFNCGSFGGPGTIFLKQKSQIYGDLIVDNNGHSGASELFGTSSNFNLLSVANYGRLTFVGNLTANNFQIKNGGIIETAATSQIAVSGDFTVEGKSSLIGPSSQIFLVINVGNNLLIRNESSLQGNLNLQIGNLILATSSLISADGKGYPSDQGPGQGRRGGGSYGGAGGYNSDARTYGSSTQPTDFGSGGGSSQISGGAGGGALIIKVNNELVFDGSTSTISANGEGGKGPIPWSAAASGGGSGGTVFITTNVLKGSGLITAAGGGSSGDGGGGGGRIAIYYETMSDFSGEIRTLGASGGWGGSDGRAGTIYLQNSLGQGQLFTSGIFPGM